jgi:hypothetical protein
MPPRRRERPMLDPEVKREMCELRARLDAMETTQRCTIDTRYINEHDNENEVGHEEEVTVKDVVDECLFRVVARIGAREKMDIRVYEGNLDVEELLDRIRSLDKYFDYEDVEEDNKVNILSRDLKGMQHYGWMNCRLTNATKASTKSKVGIEW